MDYTLPIALASAWAGFLIGRRWPDIRRIAGPEFTRPRAMRLVAFQAGPVPVVIDYAAWNAHLIYFAYQCAPLMRVSEAAVVDAGIVTRTDYRIMAGQMRTAGLWVQLPTPTGRPGKNRWGEWPPRPAIVRLSDAMRAGRVHLPYPSGKPPNISPRR